MSSSAGLGIDAPDMVVAGNPTTIRALGVDPATVRCSVVDIDSETVVAVVDFRRIGDSLKRRSIFRQVCTDCRSPPGGQERWSACCSSSTARDAGDGRVSGSPFGARAGRR